MTPGQTSQSRGMPPVSIGIYCSPVTVQRGGLWLFLWQLSLSDRSLGPLLYCTERERSGGGDVHVRTYVRTARERIARWIRKCGSCVYVLIWRQI